MELIRVFSLRLLILGLMVISPWSLSSLFSGDNDNDFQAVKEPPKASSVSGTDYSGGGPMGEFSTSAPGVSYSSGGGDGIFGVGWGGASVGSIGRDQDEGAECFAVDSTTGETLKKYDDNAGFQAGADLLQSPTNPNKYYAETGNIYSTYERIFEGNNTYWKVTGPDGGTMIFGKNTKMINPEFTDNGKGSNVCRWLLDETIDPYGNFITYESVFFENRPHLKRVKSGGRKNPDGTIAHQHTSETVYTYIDRTSIAGCVNKFSYKQGYRIGSTKLCSKMTNRTKDENGVMVDTSSVGYSYICSPDTFRPLLSEVKSFGKDGGELPSARRTFTYTQLPWEFENAVDWGPTNLPDHLKDSKAAHSISVTNGSVSELDNFDINGDGHIDRVLAYQKESPSDTNEPHYLVQYGSKNGFENIVRRYRYPIHTPPANLPGETKDFIDTVYNRSLRQGGSTAHQHMALRDGDGDGRRDRFFNPQKSGLGNYASMACSDGKAFAFEVPFGPIKLEPGTGFTEDSVFNTLNLSVQGDVHVMPANFDGSDLSNDRMVRPFHDANLAQYYLVQKCVRNADGTIGLEPFFRKLRRKGLLVSNTGTPDFQIHNAMMQISTVEGWVLSQMDDINADGVMDHITSNPGSSAQFDRWHAAFGTGWNFEAYDSTTYTIPKHPDAPTGQFIRPFGVIENAGAFNYSNEFGTFGFGFNQSQLVDVNGDGIRDIVWSAALSHQKTPSVFNNFLWVCVGTGNGFKAPRKLKNLDTQGGLTDPNRNFTPTNWPLNQVPDFAWGHPSFQVNGGTSYCEFGGDWNGDGLGGDRAFVPRDTDDKTLFASPTPQLKAFGFKVQLMKAPAEGPLPDLLICDENGLGGKLSVRYSSSTDFENTTEVIVDGLFTPKETFRVGHLRGSFPVVTQVIANDGIKDYVHNYFYIGGYNQQKSENEKWRGFWKTEVTNPNGSSVWSFHHQGDNYDGTSGGPFEKEDSFPGAWHSPTARDKIGKPYRTTSIDENGVKREIAYTQWVEHVVTTHGVTQYIAVPQKTMTQTRELFPKALARWRAAESDFDPVKGVTYREVAHGEVTAPNADNYTWVVKDPTQRVWSHTVFDQAAAGLAGTVFTQHPSAQLVSLSEDPSKESDYQRKTTFVYNLKGSLLLTRVHSLDGTGSHRDAIAQYNAYGMPTVQTGPSPAPGVLGTQSETLYEHPVYPRLATASVVDSAPGGFNWRTDTEYDVCLGVATRTTDPNGNVAEAFYDQWARTLGQWIIPNGADRQKVVEYLYNFNGIAPDGTLNNFVETRTNNGIGGENISRVYMDGNGTTRRSHVVRYDNPAEFTVTEADDDPIAMTTTATLPYLGTLAFNAPNPTVQKMVTQLDYQGRTLQVIPPVGDPKSPTGVVTTKYQDDATNDPWATVVTDSKNQITKSFVDGFGRLEKIIDPKGGCTYYRYSPLGELIEVEDDEGNITKIKYNKYGEKIEMDDPDMGVWKYEYNHKGLLFRQTDNKGNQITFKEYDSLDRPLTKIIRKMTPTGLVFDDKITWEYESDSPLKYVPKGALAKTKCKEVTTEMFYDPRGRVITTKVFLNKTGREYTTHTQYNDYFPTKTIMADYLKRSLDFTDRWSNGALRSVRDAKTGEVYDEITGWDIRGNILGCESADGKFVTTYTYYPLSHRVKEVSTRHNVLALTPIHGYEYEYDTNGLMVKIDDTLRDDEKSGDKFDIEYDATEQLTACKLRTDASGGFKTIKYRYESKDGKSKNIGNLYYFGDYAQDGGSDDGSTPDYVYHATKPHAVIEANGEKFTYDDNGNMVTRTCDTGTSLAAIQTFIYDGQNRVIKVIVDYLVETIKKDFEVTMGYGTGEQRLWKQVGADDDPDKELFVYLGSYVYQSNGNDKDAERVTISGVSGMASCTIETKFDGDVSGGLIPSTGNGSGFTSSGGSGASATGFVSGRNGLSHEEPVTHYRFNNHLGTGEVHVKCKNNNDEIETTSRSICKPFGGDLVDENLSFVPTYGFTNQVKDRTLGLMYFVAQFYESLKAKIIKPDSLEDSNEESK